MSTAKYVPWKEDRAWLGYLQDYPPTGRRGYAAPARPYTDLSGGQLSCSTQGRRPNLNSNSNHCCDVFVQLRLSVSLHKRQNSLAWNVLHSSDY